MIVLEKFMSKKGNDSKVDKYMELLVLIMWTNKKERMDYYIIKIYNSKLY